MVVLTWTLLAGFALALCAAMVIGRDCAEPASAASSAGESLLLISLAGFMASAIPTICLGASMRCDVCGRRFAVEFGVAVFAGLTIMVLGIPLYFIARNK